MEYFLIEFDSKTMRYEMNDLLKLYCLNRMEKSKSQCWKVNLKFRFVSYFASLLETLETKGEEECKTMILVEQRNIELCSSVLKILENFCQNVPADCKPDFAVEDVKKLAEKFRASVEKLCRDGSKITSEVKDLSLSPKSSQM